MKSFKNTIQAIFVGAALAAAAPATVVSADRDVPRGDQVLIVRSALTLEQLLQQRINSVEFAPQIAALNNISSVTTVLPVGTALTVPKVYLDTLDFGRIAYVKGDVTHKQTSLVVNPPRKGSQVFNGDIIQTGEDGFVSLSFKSGARVSVQPDSRVVINNIDCIDDDQNCTISLLATQGQVGSEVTPRADGQPPIEFSIETPFLTAAVRGTAFYVDLDDEKNRIGVTKGLVATAAGGANNDLPKGKGLSAGEGSAPELVDLLDPPSLSLTGDRILLSAEDDIAWDELNGAQSYRADIASDEAMVQQLASRTLTQTSFDTPELAPGDYYLTLAGIDEKAFLGLPMKRKVAIAAIVDEPRPQLSITRQDGVTDLVVPGYDGQIELLISNSVNGDNATSRILDNGSQTLSLNLDAENDWVFRARKILGPHQVSAYSEHYVLEAK